MSADTIADRKDHTLSREALLAFEEQLPALPAMMSRLLREIEDPNSSLEDIAVLISGDPSLAAQILRVANSAVFAQSGEVREILPALNLIGIDHLKTVVFSKAVDRLQLQPSMAETLIRENSIATGVAMMLIAERLDRRDGDTLFLYAVLHRIGQFVLLAHPQTRDDYPNVLKHMREREVDYATAELEVLGVTHTWVGGMLARRWNLPLEFAHVLLHFDSEGDGLEPELDELTNMVRLADLLAMASGHGTPPGHPVNARAALQLGTRLDVFFSPHENYLNGFFSEMRTKWAAAQTIWPT